MDNIYVTKSFMPEYEEYINEIKDIWTTCILTNMGEKHEKLKKLICRYLEAEHIELLTNGHMALEMVIKAFDFPVGGEVITTPFTFASTTHAIVRNGLKPVFCDIDRTNYCIDASLIENKITDKTVAILPVHVYGNICDVEQIQQIAKKYGLKVIYDAAHTFGAKYNNHSASAFGDATCYSFHATKVFNTIEGGAVTYKDPDIGQKVYELKNFGIHGPESVVSVGANAKMNEFCAAMGICNLRHIDEEIEKRKAIDDRYRVLLGGIPGIQLNERNSSVKSNYAYFPVLIDEARFGESREELFDRLAKEGVYARKYFYPLVSDYDCYKDSYDSKDTPVAKWVSDRVLTLPMYGSLAIDDVDRICNIITTR